MLIAEEADIWASQFHAWPCNRRTAFIVSPYPSTRVVNHNNSTKRLGFSLDLTLSPLCVDIDTRPQANVVKETLVDA
jgi:hypothetical protein